MGSKNRLAGLRAHLTYANVMVTILAFIVLGGGTALAAVIITDNSQVARDTISGHNPPTGDLSNIISGSVNGQDLAARAVSGGKLANNSIGGSKVIDGSLTGADVASNSLTGAQIDESTLGEVPGAQGAEVAEIGGLGRYTGDQSCTPSGTAYEDCAIVTLSLPRQANVLLIGHVMADDNTNYEAYGNCKLVTQFGDVANTVTSFDVPSGPVGSAADNGTLAGLTGNLGPGSVDFGIDCNRTGGINLDYVRASITAVAISPY
jgi:hypothetical protein